MLFPQFYPGSGEKDLMASNVVNVPVAPLWRRIAPPPKAKAKAEGSSNNGSGGVGGSRDVLADAQHLPKRASVNTSTRVVARVHAAARSPRQEQMH